MFKDEYREMYDAVKPDPEFRQRLEGRIENMQKKRNGWMPRTAVITLAAMLALTGAGLATGAFRSIFGGMMNTWQNGPAEDYAHMESAANTNVFEQTVIFENGISAQVRLEQSYYNGRQLATGWSVASDAKAELFDKSDSRAADAEEGVLSVELGEKVGTETAAEFYRRFESDGWAGVAWYECYLSDQTYLADAEKVVGDDGLEHASDDALLYPETDHDWRENGVYLSFDEFETPLPEKAQDRERLLLARKVVCQQCWLIIDGDRVYNGRSPAERVELTFEVERSEDYVQTEHMIEAEFPDHSARISLVRTPVRAEFTVENRISDEWKAIWESYDGYLHAPLKLAQDIVFDYEIWVDGRQIYFQTDRYMGAEGMTGWFMLPADAKEIVFRPVYANSGARAEEDVTIKLN